MCATQSSTKIKWNRKNDGRTIMRFQMNALYTHLINREHTAAAAADGRCWFGSAVEILWFITINQSNWSDEVHNSLHILHSICCVYTVYRLILRFQYQNMANPDIIFGQCIKLMYSSFEKCSTLIRIWHEKEKKKMDKSSERKQMVNIDKCIVNRRK